MITEGLVVKINASILIQFIPPFVLDHTVWITEYHLFNFHYLVAQDNILE